MFSFVYLPGMFVVVDLMRELRLPISPKEQLAVTLRCLGTGNSQRDSPFKIVRSTLQNITLRFVRIFVVF